MRYRIFPSIGIARVGEDNDFFLGPERPGGGPGELQNDGTTTPVTRFKNADATKIRKQGARFHIFESADGTNWAPANLPAGATVTWSVHLENKKAAVTRPEDPPTQVMRPEVPAGNEALVIKGGKVAISGSNAQSNPLVGRYETSAPDGSPFSVDVELGRLRTDAQGRLIVLGGNGFSSAPPGMPIGGPPPANSYYRNPKWHDDVSDGPVTATIQLSSSSAPVDAEGGAWVVVGPPDYAPEIACIVSLYDVIKQVGILNHGLATPGQPSFDLDIAPMLASVRRLQWVHEDANWSDPRLSDPRCRSKSAADKPFRGGVRDLVLEVQNVFEGHTSPLGPPFQLRKFQKDLLDAWVDGNFDDTPASVPAALTAEGLTRAALECTAGQGFCPGIEAGIIVLDPSLYTTPFDFRIDHTAVAAGDLTALMAQPWQADFLKCNTEWWPTQRPDLAPQEDGSFEDWIRGANKHLLLVQRYARLGFVVRQGDDEVFVERERNLPS
jgi:hypothetical protein